MTTLGYVTDGGLETDLIFHRGVPLPEFAAFPLVASAAGRAVLTDYYDGYAGIAARAGAGLLLESPTWRANPDWGARLGYDAGALAGANEAAIGYLHDLRGRYAGTVPEIRLVGTVGPRGDGYRPGAAVHPDEAQGYHAAQLDAFARAGADLAAVYTLTDPGEAIGIVRAARSAGLPVAVSFTVETDGRLPDGRSLAAAVSTVDDAAPPDHFLVNCAHPVHVGAALAEPGDWRSRIAGLRCNASMRSHAELDEAETLDEGDPAGLATAQQRLVPLLPNLSIVGGCCGTDARHVAALWRVAPG